VIHRDPIRRALANHRPGYVVLSPSRVVYWTGVLAIGLKYRRPQFYVEQQSERDAEHLQCLLLRSA